MVMELMWPVCQLLLVLWKKKILMLSYVLNCLGTILGQEYGLARKATAIGVRVLGDSGAGTIE